MPDVPSTPTRVAFSARDFDTAFDDLSKRLQDQYGDTYNDFGSSSFGMMLVDLFAWSADQLHWYLDRRATESYLETALHRSSVSRLTRQIGYAMRPASSATRDLSVAPRFAQDFGWSVPVGFQFRGPNGLVFECTQEVSWSAGDDSTKTVTVREGSQKRVTTASNGAANQEIRLAAANGSDKFLVQGTVRVFVDGAEWTELEFLEFEQTDTFEVHYLDEPPLVRFGNGVAGNIPPLGAEIRVLFVVGSGSKGNVASGTIDDVVRPLVERFTTIVLTVNNEGPSSGGDGPETIESAKVNAPKFFASRGVAVTESDYQALASAFMDPQYGRVAKATALCARTAGGDALATNLLNDARAQIDQYQSSLATTASDLETSLDAAQTATDAAQVQAAIVDSKLTDIESNVVVINGAALTIQGRSGAIQDAIDVIEDATTDNTVGYTVTLADIVAILTTEGYTAEAAQLTTINNDLAAALAGLTTAKSDIDSAATSIKSSAQTIQTDVDDAQLAQATLTSSLVATETGLTGADTSRVAVETAVASHTTAINTAFDGVVEHLDEVVAADCKANIISVPILAADGDGFYTAPSVGLIRRLQGYLSERSDVAHSVSVTSGSGQLVAAHIVAEIRRLDAYTYQEVANDVDAAFRAVLKGRNFGDSLYLSQLYGLAQDIDGLDVINITITGDEDFLDDNGNLIVDQEHVVTYGSVATTELI
jgi:hypothetical protein